VANDGDGVAFVALDNAKKGGQNPGGEASPRLTTGPVQLEVPEIVHLLAYLGELLEDLMNGQSLDLTKVDLRETWHNDWLLSSHLADPLGGAPGAGERAGDKGVDRDVAEAGSDPSSLALA
jgi:hypothetical protein